MLMDREGNKKSGLSMGETRAYGKISNLIFLIQPNGLTFDMTYKNVNLESIEDFYLISMCP